MHEEIEEEEYEAAGADESPDLFNEDDSAEEVEDDVAPTQAVTVVVRIRPLLPDEAVVDGRPATTAVSLPYPSDRNKARRPFLFLFLVHRNLRCC